jgi:SSS family solute:Na+ symporter
VNLTTIDWIIIGVYFAFVIGIGAVLKRYMRSSADFFLAGRSLPAWICGLAFLSANLGAQEVIGMAASGAKYGIETSHFYWIGAVPAMVFVGVFMMPFYYGSRARSVPEYLRLRFDEKTRAFNAVSFALMTVFSSGISMYAMAKLILLLHILDGPFSKLGVSSAWSFHVCIVLSAVIVVAYILLGGLTSAIYNEVLQFFLIVAGFLPLVFLGLRDVGGWSGLKQRLPVAFTHSWQGLGNPHTNGFGVDAFALAMGLGFVLSFGYWCTDFLVVQRAMAADSVNAAQRTPLLAALPKMLFPLLVILPGMIAIALPNPAAVTSNAGVGQTHVLNQAGKGLIPPKINPSTGAAEIAADGSPVLDYDLAIPNMLLHYFPTGMLGLGVTALLASFMSGMAGNVTAFNTVWTYDIYQSYINRHGTDQHYLWMGRVATVFGVALSVAAAYAATRFNNIMDFLQLVFAFVNAPLFATFLLGMFWKKTTSDAAFWGLLSGTSAAALHHGLTLPLGSAVGIKGGWLTGAHIYPSEMAQNFWTAIWAWSVCFAVTILVSLFTRGRDEKDLVGLVYSLTQRPDQKHLAWYMRPAILGLIVMGLVLVLNVIFW